MAKKWWPFNRSEDDPAEDRVRKKRVDETRRIARYVAKQAFQASQPEEPPPPPPRPKTPTSKAYGDIVHVNFHREWAPEILRKDPITRQIDRRPKDFTKSNVFYTRDGRLISDDTRPGQTGRLGHDRLDRT